MSLFYFGHMNTFAVQKASLNSRLSVAKALLATMSRNNKYPKHRELLEVYYKNTEKALLRSSQSRSDPGLAVVQRDATESRYSSLTLRIRGFERLLQCN